MGGEALRISELLLPRPWWIAEYDSPALLTSDEPVALHFRDRSRRPAHDRGIAYTDVYRRELRPVITTGAEIMDQLFTQT